MYEFELRVCKMAEFIQGLNGFCLNIGPGAVELEFLINDRIRVSLDENADYLKKFIGFDGIILVKGVAERLPFRDGVLPIVVTQSTFQVMRDQKAFLRELSRVLKGVFIITIEYGNIYNPKKHDFKFYEVDRLKEFVGDLRLKVTEVRYLNHEGEWVENASEGFSLWIFGDKCFIPSREV